MSICIVIYVVKYIIFSFLVGAFLIFWFQNCLLFLQTSSLLLSAQPDYQVLLHTQLFNIFLGAVFDYSTVFVALKGEPADVADIL